MKPLESIRQDIEDLRELILSLDDEIWSRIDHRDNEALVGFLPLKTRINDRIQTFQQAAEELLDVIAEVPAIQLPEKVAIEAIDEANETMASLSRPFTELKPTAFLWNGSRIGPTLHWKTLWQRFLQEFHRSYPGKFEEHLVKNPCIARIKDTPEEMTAPFSCGGRWFECNLSAEDIRFNIRRILAHSHIDMDYMKVILRGKPDTDDTELFGKAKG
jgi:hypothetical protein